MDTLESQIHSANSVFTQEVLEQMITKSCCTCSGGDRDGCGDCRSGGCCGELGFEENEDVEQGEGTSWVEIGSLMIGLAGCGVAAG